MNPLATLLNWLAPLLHPLGDFRKQVSKLATIHQNSVHTFSALAGGLVENQAGPEAFTGELETSFWERVQTYLNAENALIDASVGAGMAGGNAATMEGIVAEASATCEECAAEITTAAEVAAAEVAGDVVLDEVTGIVDAAAVAEVGANPIADVAAIILTLVAGVALLATLTKLAWDIYHAIQHWQSAMNTIADTNLSNLPPNPTPVPAPTSNAISPMNSGNDLNDAQKRLLNDVRSRLGNGPYNDAEIEALIRAGYLDPDAIAAMIKSGSSADFNSANIAKMMNTLTGTQQLNIIDLITRTNYGKNLAGSENDPKRLLIDEYTQIYGDFNAGKITQRQLNTKLQEVNGIVASIFDKPEYVRSMMDHNIKLTDLYATIKDSNVDFRMTPNNAITALVGPKDTARIEVAGPSGTLGDVKFYDNKGNLIFTRENKSLTTTSRSGFNSAVSDAMNEMQLSNGQPAEIFLQMQPGMNSSDFGSWVKRYMGPRINAGQAGKYTNVLIKVVDPSGKVLYAGKMVP